MLSTELAVIFPRVLLVGAVLIYVIDSEVGQSFPNISEERHRHRYATQESVGGANAEAVSFEPGPV